MNRVQSIVLDAIRECVRLGLPICAELHGYTLLVESKHGRGFYKVKVLKNLLEAHSYSVVIEGVEGETVIAEIRGLYALIFLENIPYAISTNPHVMSLWEADTWHYLITELPRAEPCSKTSCANTCYCIPSNPCLVIHVDNYGVSLVCDVCTNMCIDPKPWQKRVGLRPSLEDPPLQSP